jgi:hypothetical protein
VATKETSNPPRVSVAGVLVYSGILIALIYLLDFQVSPGQPMHMTTAPPGSELLRNIDTVIATAANKKPVQLHIHANAQDWQVNAGFLAAVYFSAVYQQFPLAVVVGDGNSIINFPAQLHTADQAQSDTALHSRHIAAVVSLFPGDTSGWHAVIHRVP